MKNIIETAVEAGTFTTLVAATKAAGLVETLSGPGPFTVFAPTEDAFKNLPLGTLDMLLKPENKAKLVSVLTYHVVSGKAKAADVTAKKEWKTVEGSNVHIDTTDGNKIENAKIVKTDIECSNGYIHVINAVILPPSMIEKKAA
jgi:transforming growth factor-beta-induced protein